MSGDDEEDKQIGKREFIRKDAFGNQIIKNNKKYKVSFADMLEKSSEERLKKELVEIVEIDCYKEYNKFKMMENDEEEDDRNYEKEFKYEKNFNNEDEEVHDSSDPGRSCLFF
jgi:hypothetical protein